MKAIIQKKADAVNALVKDLEGATAVLAFEYHGATAKDITATRKALHIGKSKMYVAKNNIFNRALKLANITELGELSGPNALVVAHGDEVIPYKELNELMKICKKVVFKGGVIGKTKVTADQVAVLAAIPGREGLLSMLLSVIQAPIRNLAYGIKALGESKQQ